jgi:hypothetical protein
VDFFLVVLAGDLPPSYRNHETLPQFMMID